MPQAADRYQVAGNSLMGVGWAGGNRWNPFDNPVVVNFGKGVASEALSRSTIRGLAAYHRAAFRLQKTPIQVLTGFNRIPISKWVDEGAVDN